MKTKSSFLELCVSAVVTGFLISIVSPISAAVLPTEPMEIGTTPQFFIDDYVVDNRWAVKQKTEEVLRVFHAPKKYEGNPVVVDEGGYVSVARDPEAGVYKMWYQTHSWTKSGDEDDSDYAIGYAESKDGLNWMRPKLRLYEWKGTKENNIVWRGISDARASGPQILTVPERDRRGYRYLLTYRTAGAKRGLSGIRVVGSQDGIHWDKKGDSLIHTLPSDTLNSIVYDTGRDEYVMYCRPKNVYRVFQGDILDTGESRRVARMSGKSIWEKWETQPQSILIPDEEDMARGFNRFYGMPAKYHAGIFWGSLWLFKLNTDIHTELAVSRDGIGFERMPGRPKLVELGPNGAWDDGMVFGSPDWIEVADEWWIYYAGSDGPHESKERKAGLGLSKIRKEGFISLRGPKGGGVIATRQIRWPGGDLVVNVNATQGEFKVRISEDRRKPAEGFNYSDCQAFSGDNVAHVVKWNGKSMNELKGRVVRIEFYLKDADVYTFRASGG